MMVPLETDLAPAQKAILNQQVSNLRLNFEPNDIKYIIIRKDDEIEEFIKAIRSSRGKVFSQIDTERLTTRIVTSDQILGDF